MLSLILKYSSPVSSPATPGLTASPSDCKKFEMSRGHKEDSPRRRTPRPGRRAGGGGGAAEEACQYIEEAAGGGGVAVEEARRWSRPSRSRRSSGCGTRSASGRGVGGRRGAM